jgi:hypothetical protein
MAKVWKGKMMGEDALWFMQWMGTQGWAIPKWIRRTGVYAFTIRPLSPKGKRQRRK